ncbi:MAG: helix-hairpin-helix domain-containing protein [Bryobacterales bacterium]|nr:helix-hairpin-helix domain-containing protein [Bryobacterales bacterium]
MTGLPVETLLKVSEEVEIPLKSLLELVQQAENGATAGFLARYRPDLCAGIDEEAVHNLLDRLAELRDIEDRRISMIATLSQRGLMSDALRRQLQGATSRRDLGDIYMPYRERKAGAAEEAISKGLDPLARVLWMQQEGVDIDAEAAKHVAPDGELSDPAQALDGAYEIAAQWLSDKPEIVRALRKVYLKESEVSVRTRPSAAKVPRVRALDGFRAKAATLDWRRQLQIRRGVRSGMLDVDFRSPTAAALEFLERRLIQDPDSAYAQHLRKVVTVAMGNGLSERIKNSVQAILNEQADERAVDAYRTELRRVLLSPPASGLGILGIEITRSGEWHAALVGADGRLEECAVVRSDRKPRGKSAGKGKIPESSAVRGGRPDAEAAQEDTRQDAAKETGDAPAAATANGERGVSEPKPKSARVPRRPTRVELAEFLSSRAVDLVVCAGGSRPHTSEEFLRSQIRKAGRLDLPWRVVRDPGARMFARTRVARRIYRRLPTTFAIAATMARRTQDPLAELTRSDFRSTGIGANYLEVNSDLLRKAHRRTLESVLHELGVDVNSASAAMLALVPGLNDRLARRIVAHRAKHGPFAARSEVQNVEGLTPRAFAQAVGFLRVQGDDPLDSTAGHPEYRELYDSIAEAAGCDLETLLREPERLEDVDAEQLAGPDRSVHLVRSAIKDLSPERRKSRAEFEPPKRAVPLRTDEELQPGNKVTGVISNTADFGAFVDIGADNDGFLHVSQIDRQFLSDSRPNFRQGDTVEVFIRPPLEGNRRIGLTMRPRAATPRAAASRPRPGFGERPFRPGRKPGRGRRDRGKPYRQVFGPSKKGHRRKGRREGRLTLSEKLDLLSDRYRTRV